MRKGSCHVDAVWCVPYTELLGIMSGRCSVRTFHAQHFGPVVFEPLGGYPPPATHIHNALHVEPPEHPRPQSHRLSMRVIEGEAYAHTFIDSLEILPICVLEYNTCLHRAL